MSEPEPSAASWRSGTCQANGIDIHYRRTDAGRPPPVALHGLIGSGACLLPLARALEKDFDLILPDARPPARVSFSAPAPTGRDAAF